MGIKETLSLAEHEEYAEALAHLESIFKLQDTASQYYKISEEQMRKADLFGKTVCVSDKQFPRVYNIVSMIASELELETPNVYIYEDFYYGAEVRGLECPWIEMSAKTVRDFSDQELQFLIARLMYKIAIGAAKKESIFLQLIKGSKELVMVGSEASSIILNLKFAHWARITNYSADCFAYMVIRDLEKAIRTILTLILNSRELAAEVNVAEYISQGAKISLLDGVIDRYTKADEHMPYGPYRIKYLLQFAGK